VKQKEQYLKEAVENGYDSQFEAHISEILIDIRDILNTRLK